MKKLLLFLFIVNCQLSIVNSYASVCDGAFIHFTTVNRDSIVFQHTGASVGYYSWTFGDGDTSNLMDPSHVYPGPGTYTVCLHVMTVPAGDTCSFCDSVVIAPLKVTIIESQSINSGHNMDMQWYNLLTSEGHNANIYPQTTLDDTNFFSTTDILIVSSGVITIPSNRESVIRQFLAEGGKVYLQTEYDPSLSSNQVFQSIVTSMGASFNWSGITPNYLDPMNVLSSMSWPNAIQPLTLFWYGSPGAGCNGIEPFLEYNGSYYGFIFCSHGLGGRMVTTCDQDWIRTAGSNELLLMDNIIYNLSLPYYTCPFISQPAINQSGDSLICTPAVTYQWYDYSGAMSGATNQGLHPPHVGWYHVCVTYSQGCSACSDSIFVETITGVESVSGNDFTLFPNPAANSITIRLANNSAEAIVKIYDIQGSLKYMHRVTNESVLDIGILNSGMYFIEVSSGDKTGRQRLVKQ